MFGHAKLVVGATLVLGYLLPDVLYGEPGGVIKEPIAAAGLFELCCGAILLGTSPLQAQRERKVRRRQSPRRRGAKSVLS